MKEYADANEMKINYKKTKIMLFNSYTSIDFVPEVRLENHDIEVVEEIRLLGLIINSDMKWHSNTDNMVKRASKKLWILRRLKNSGAKNDDLVDVYTKQVRSLLELAVPAWHGCINQAEHMDIERIQKSAAHIILGENYLSYRNALKEMSLEPLGNRRDRLCLNFAIKAEKRPKHINWFKPNVNPVNTRKEKLNYMEGQAKHTRFKDSPQSFLTNLLNDHYSK